MAKVLPRVYAIKCNDKDLGFPLTTPLVDRRGFQNRLLILVGVFVIAWAVVRALVQSITIDEAFTYTYLAAKPILGVFGPGSTNHLLNSLLMWFTTRAFGTSDLTVRLPALLGAVLYVSVCYFLCKSLTSKFSLRLPLFICLTCNPFILDYMVAARGYSLANAFLLSAIAIPVWHGVKGWPSLPASCAWASVALGLSFASNVSFAFVNGAAYLAILIWAIQWREGQSIWRIAGFCSLPGLAVAALFCGYAVLHWERADLYWGAHSLNEMTRSLVESSFYQLAPQIRGSFYKVLRFVQPQLLPALELLCAFQLAVVGFDGSWRRDARARWLAGLAAALLGIVTLSVTLSWLAFRLDDLLLPLGRTGIYFVPLCTLLAGTIAALPTAKYRISRWLSCGITAVLICLACYFLLCLRLSYFREYPSGADVKEVYSVLAKINHTYGVTDVNATGYYVDPLNYYAGLSKRETFPELKREDPELSAGRFVYVIDASIWRDFIEKEKLVVVYRGKFSTVVVAVRSDGPIPPAMIEP